MSSYKFRERFLFPPLHQNGIGLAATDYLGGRVLAAKEYIVSLAVSNNGQGNIIPWRILEAAKKIYNYLGSSCKPPRKITISFALFC